MKIDWKKEISLPKLRRPPLPKPRRRSAPKLSRPSLGGPDLHAPKFLVDLYADLRDRRLLPLVALLVIAIIAAPILLAGKGDHEEPAAITPAAVAEGETKDAGLTVVPAETGLHDYQRRLGHRVALNPFRRLPEEERAPASEASGSESASASGSESGSGGGSSATASTNESMVTTTVGNVTTEVPASSVEQAPVEKSHHQHRKSGQLESAQEETTPTEPAKEETTKEQTTAAEPTAGAEAATPAAPAQSAVVGYTIDAEAGFVPKTTEKTGIAPMTKLPNKKHPLVLFIGLSKDHKRALFLMTSSVTAYYGGHCALDKQACQLVEVPAGKGVTFAAGYGESRYKLHVKKIVPIRSKAP